MQSAFLHWQTLCSSSEMYRYLHNTHTYQIYADGFVDSSSHEFSHNENAVWSYSTTQKLIVSKLFTALLALSCARQSELQHLTSKGLREDCAGLQFYHSFCYKELVSFDSCRSSLRQYSGRRSYLQIMLYVRN